MLALVLALAAVQDASPAATPVSAKTDKPQCRRVEPTTGSLMPGKRVCHSKAEWASIDRASDQSVGSYRGVAGGSAMGVPGDVSTP